MTFFFQIQSDGKKMVPQNPERIKGKELPKAGCSVLPLTEISPLRRIPIGSLDQRASSLPSA